MTDRLLVTLAGLAGLLGVAFSAAAAHVTGGGHLETAGRFLLVHAAALVGLVALVGAGLVHANIGRLAGWALLLGLALFAGDLAYRTWRGEPVFPMAAPAGGIHLMAGWGLAALAALLGARS